MEEGIKADTKEEDTKGTREPGAQEAKATGPWAVKAYKGTQEEVKEDMEVQRGTKEVKEDTKEEAKDGIRLGEAL